MTTELGPSGSRVSFPDPEQKGYTENLEPVGDSRRTLNGSLKVHYVTSKMRITVPYRGLTETQKDNLTTEAKRTEDLEFLTPEGGTYTVRVEQFSWHKEAPARYAADLELREI